MKRLPNSVGANTIDGQCEIAVKAPDYCDKDHLPLADSADSAEVAPSITLNAKAASNSLNLYESSERKRRRKSATRMISNDL